MVYMFKISATILFWAFPLLVTPASMLVDLGILRSKEDAMSLHLLGIAYLALCLNYGFGLQASLHGKILPEPGSENDWLQSE